VVNAGGENPSRTPQRRLILLGASNVARGIASAVAAADAAWNQPLDLLAAFGHGRSYGLPSMVLGRTLTGIVQCQLWNDLDARAALPTSAIVTDVGNDLLYGASPEKISAWVKNSFERLSRHHAAIVVSGIPLASIAKLRPWEFRFFRAIFYPNSHLTFADALAAAGELDERLRELSKEFDAQFVEPETAWYSVDRIHIRRSAQRFAWRQFFAPFAAESLDELPSATLRRFLYLRALTPYQRWLFGIPNGRAQPSGRLPNGTVVSLY
jgi:hypothetical protein